MCMLAGLVVVSLPCGEGTSLEYNRSLGSGYASNERKKEDRAEGVMEGASERAFCCIAFAFPANARTISCISESTLR